MEELLIAIFQLVLEILAQVLVELPWDFSLGAGERRAGAAGTESNYWAWGLGSLVVGAAAGGLSLLIVPHTLIRSSQFRIAYLFLAPITSVLVSFFISKLRRSESRPWNRPGMHGLCAFLFAVAMTVIRFAYAKR